MNVKATFLDDMVHHHFVHQHGDEEAEHGDCGQVAREHRDHIVDITRILIILHHLEL